MVIDDGTEAASRPRSWREGVERDLIAAFGPDRVLVTGSGGKLSNDLDVSVLGPNASRDRERVRMWLAARAGGSPDELRRLIHCDVFTDPLRMHPADLAAAGLSDAVREQINRAQAVRQEHCCTITASTRRGPRRTPRPRRRSARRCGPCPWTRSRTSAP